MPLPLILWEKQNKIQNSKLKVEQEREEEKKRTARQLNKAVMGIDAFLSKAITAGGSKVIAETLDDMNVEGLRSLSDKIKTKENSVVILLATKSVGKASFIVSVTEDLTKKGINAGEVAKEFAALIGGSGGGKPAFAQGGGKDIGSLEDAFGKIKEIIMKRLK